MPQQEEGPFLAWLAAVEEMYIGSSDPEATGHTMRLIAHFRDDYHALNDWLISQNFPLYMKKGDKMKWWAENAERIAILIEQMDSCGN